MEEWRGEEVQVEEEWREGYRWRSGGVGAGGGRKTFGPAVRVAGFSGCKALPKLQIDS